MNNRRFSMILAVALICALIALPADVTAQAIPRPQPDGDLILSDDFTDAAQSAQQAFGDEWMRWEVSDGIGRLSSSTQ